MEHVDYIRESPKSVDAETYYKVSRKLLSVKNMCVKPGIDYLQRNMQCIVQRNVFRTCERAREHTKTSCAHSTCFRSTRVVVVVRRTLCVRAGPFATFYIQENALLRG